MTIYEKTFRDAWVQQGAKPNCGSCCMASIVNYARKIRKDINIAEMDEDTYIGLTVTGVHGLGSVSSRLFQWLTHTYPGKFSVEEVKVDSKKAHWGGVLNQFTGGTPHRPTVIPDAPYFAKRHRFLLREFSAMVVAGHFIIQTGDNDFWDPNFPEGVLPRNLAETKREHTALSARADALQIDVITLKL